MLAVRHTKQPDTPRRRHPYWVQLDVAGDLYGLDDLCRVTGLDRPESPAALTRLGERFRDAVLLPRELPALLATHEFARRGRSRELLKEEKKLALARDWRALVAPSRRVGGHLLSQLRPLRDERIVQRFLDAHCAGRTPGFHLTVLGVTSALFHVPPRQVLWDYALTLLDGLALTAGQRLRLAAPTRQAIVRNISQPIPPKLGSMLDESDFGVKIA